MKCPHCYTTVQSLPSKCPHCTGDITYERVDFQKLLISSLKSCAVICIGIFVYGVYNSSRLSAKEVFEAVLSGIALTVIAGVGFAINAYANPKPLKNSSNANIFNVHIESKEDSVLKNNYQEKKSQNQNPELQKNKINVPIESKENSLLKNNYLEEKSQNQNPDPYQNNIRQKIRDECARIVIFKIFASIASFIVVIICLREMNGTRFFQ